MFQCVLVLQRIDAITETLEGRLQFAFRSGLETGSVADLRHCLHIYTLIEKVGVFRCFIFVNAGSSQTKEAELLYQEVVVRPALAQVSVSGKKELCCFVLLFLLFLLFFAFANKSIRFRYFVHTRPRQQRFSLFSMAFWLLPKVSPTLVVVFLVGPPIFCSSIQTDKCGRLTAATALLPVKRFDFMVNAVWPEVQVFCLFFW
jgi:hypothetical protein